MQTGGAIAAARASQQSKRTTGDGGMRARNQSNDLGSLSSGPGDGRGTSMDLRCTPRSNDHGSGATKNAAASFVANIYLKPYDILGRPLGGGSGDGFDHNPSSELGYTRDAARAFSSSLLSGG